MIWGNPPGQKYKKIRGKTWERQDWSKSKKEMQEEGKAQTSGFMGASNYRVLEDGKYYILYTR